MRTKSLAFSVLFVPSGPRRVASARLRAFQYLEPLRSAGIKCTIFPASSETTAMLRVLSPRMPRAVRLAYYALVLVEHGFRLIPVLALAAVHDVVYLQRTTFPPPALRLLRAINPRVIFDFDDAIHLRNPGDGERGLIARLKEGSKSRSVAAVLRASRCAIVPQATLGAYARRHCPRVEIIPGPVDTDRFFPKPASGRPAGGPVIIGWTGTPSTSLFLQIPAQALRRLAARHNIEVHLVGSGHVGLPGVPVQIHPWSEGDEPEHLRSFDIGIMPMPDSDWTRGKGGLKMLLYMATGLPSVASYTPANAEIVRDGVNGYIARSDKDWERSLEALILDASLRQRVGKEGRATVESVYSLRAAVPKLARIMAEVSGRPAA